MKGALTRTLRRPEVLVSAGLLAAVVLACVLAPVLPLRDPATTNLDARLLAPLSSGHLLGTDQLGRDLLARLVFGTRLSLLVALSGVSVAAVFGTLAGIVTSLVVGPGSRDTATTATSGGSCSNAVRKFASRSPKFVPKAKNTRCCVSLTKRTPQFRPSDSDSSLRAATG